MENKPKKIWPYVLCSGITAVVVFAATLLGAFAGFYSHQAKQPAAPAGDGETPAYLSKIEELVSLLDEKYVDGIDMQVMNDTLSSAAVAATGDRWSYYISAADFAAYLESNANAYVGIGVTIQRPENEAEAEGFEITIVTPGGPAEAAGIVPGDIMTAVEGESVIELGMTETKNHVRGEEGTQVNLTILRDGQPMDIAVTRAKIEVEVVSYELLDNAIGYIKINNFDSNCSRDTLAAIEALRADGAQSLIFDLRFNPGGMKTELLTVLNYLLPEGPLFTSVDYQGHESTDYSDANYLDLPMAVLVNGDSYSAAEFFAAALQEYDAGIVVGTQTCGKGNYQQTFPLSDGSAVAVSTGHYKTPHGVALTNVGVTPDVVVEVDDETYQELYLGQVEKAEDSQLQAAISTLSQEKP